MQQVLPVPAVGAPGRECIVGAFDSAVYLVEGGDRYSTDFLEGGGIAGDEFGHVRFRSFVEGHFRPALLPVGEVLLHKPVPAKQGGDHCSVGELQHKLFVVLWV